MGAPPAPPPLPACSLLSPKLATLVGVLLPYTAGVSPRGGAGASASDSGSGGGGGVGIGGAGWSCIVFVTQRMAAWALHTLLG